MAVSSTAFGESYDGAFDRPTDFARGPDWEQPASRTPSIAAGRKKKADLAILAAPEAIVESDQTNPVLVAPGTIRTSGRFVNRPAGHTHSKPKSSAARSLQ